ncbi:MAG TPA: 2OG-Fe(II) oxygenase [Gaiellaceae bacterium]|nr:2OG-Fe(II) oxygenase [Gaiellaceae bacterium]
MDPAFFTRFGLFFKPDFLPPDTCTRLRGAIDAAPTLAAEIEDKGAEAVNKKQRSTSMANVDDETHDFVVQRLDALRATLGQHFDVSLERCQRPQFLVYREGDFFGTHRDSSEDEDAAQFRKERQISAVTFLNDQSADPRADAYGGGNLTFYGLLNEDPKGEGVGFALTAQQGTLVAFPSLMVHSVSPVTHGKRYTITTWFA